jgi:hypothetical protein
MLDTNILAIILLGGTAPLLGFVGLMGCFGRRLRVIVLSSSAVSLCSLAAVSGYLGQSLYLWLPSAVLAVLCCLCVFIGSSLVERVLYCMLLLVRWKAIPFAALLVVGPVLAVAWLWRLDAESAPPEPDFSANPAFAAVDLERAAPSRAYSDAGRPLPLYRISEHISQGDLNATDGTLFDAWGLNGHVIRTAAASDEYNCHGWVFAEGHFWIKGEDVPTILEDNGYHATTKPQIGDIVVYCDYGGHVAHSGIIRVATPDTPILIESKLGKGGRFIHPPDALRYGVDITYYHTARQDHSIFSHHGSSDPGVEQQNNSEQISTED